MASFRPELFDIGSVLNYYDMNADKFPNWRIYAGANCNKDFLRFEQIGDMNNAGAELNNALQAIKANPKNTNPYTLQLFAGEGKKGDSRSIIFLLNDPAAASVGAYQPAGPMMGNNEILFQLLQEQKETNRALLSKINAIEERLNEPGDEDEEPEEDNILAGLLKNPEVQNKAVDFVMGLFGQKSPAAIAGIPSEQNEVVSMVSELIEREPLFVDILRAVYQKEVAKPGTVKKLHGYLNFL